MTPMTPLRSPETTQTPLTGALHQLFNVAYIYPQNSLRALETSETPSCSKEALPYFLAEAATGMPFACGQLHSKLFF